MKLFSHRSLRSPDLTPIGKVSKRGCGLSVSRLRGEKPEVKESAFARKLRAETEQNRLARQALAAEIRKEVPLKQGKNGHYFQVRNEKGQVGPAIYISDTLAAKLAS